MNIAWVLAEHAVLLSSVTGNSLNTAAPIWSSWRHVRGYQVDNAVCYNALMAQRLIDQGWHQLCNLYVPDAVIQKNPASRVSAFGGSFDLNIPSQDDIVCAHLAAAQSNVVLLLGFDLDRSTPENQTYVDLIYAVMDSYPKVQWVMIDPEGKPEPRFFELTNFTCDSIQNVLNLLGGQ